MKGKCVYNIKWVGGKFRSFFFFASVWLFFTFYKWCWMLLGQKKVKFDLTGGRAKDTKTDVSNNKT